MTDLRGSGSIRADADPEATPQPDDIRNKLEDLVGGIIGAPAG